jgi:hypothetical protein
VYSLGVIMYEAVTGQVPFDAGTFNQLMFKIVLAEVPPPQAVVADLDPAFATIISKTMARDVTQRFQSTQDVIVALDAWMHSAKAVTMPPMNEAASAGHLPQGARGTLASVSDAQAAPNPSPTAGSWATSQPGAAVPKKSAAPVIALVLGLGLLIAGGAAFAAYSLHNKSLAAASSAAAAQAVAPSVASEAKTALPAPVAVLTAPPPKSAAESAPAPATAIAAAPTAVAPPGVPAAALRLPAQHGQVRPAPAAAKPEVTEKPAPAPAAKPASAPDFGY